MHWKTASMFVTKMFLTTMVLLVLLVTVFPRYSLCMNTSHVTTQCGENVPIENAEQEHLIVNLTFSQPQPSGASCTWLILNGNASMSNSVMLTGMANVGALSCDQNAFSVSEVDPESNAPSPLTLECLDKSVNKNLSLYKAVTGQPGFPLVVTLNTASALSANFVFMHIFPIVWSQETCPRTEPKILVAEPGVGQTFDPASSSSLLGRFPNNLVCKWEFQSPDEGIVHLEIRTYVYDSDSSQLCGGGDHFTVTDSNGGTDSDIVPLCKNPGIHFEHQSLTGSVLVNMTSDSSGGAYQSFYFKYWSVPSCPLSPHVRKIYVGENYHFKGSSFSALGAGQEQQCQWQITTHSRSVIKLYQLEAQEFQQNCNESKDYLLVNGQKVSICISSAFPLWSEGNTMNITLQTSTEVHRRSFVLNYTAVFKSACQGHPLQTTVVGSKYRGDLVRLMPIPQGDIRNGLVCQWIFTAEDEDNTVRVEVDWAETGSSTEDDGVPFNKETCSFSNFRVYDGITVNSSAEITPTCSEDKLTIIYTSSSRDMLFMYHRESDVAESGFLMETNQVQVTSSGSSSWKDVSFFMLRAGLVGLFAFVLVDLFS